MGTDISVFVEYDASGEPPFSGAASGLSDGPFYVPRAYRLFAALAGIRCDEPPVFPVRGLPAILSDAVADHFYLPVVTPDDEPEWRGTERYVLQADASSWVDEGLSHYLFEHGQILVSDPDLYSEGWLTLVEIRQALEARQVPPEDIPLQFMLVRDIMVAVEKRVGMGRTRPIFWLSD